MDITVVTGNRDKFREITAALKGFGIKAKMEKLELNEDGRSLEAIAESKAEQAFRKLKKPLIVDDTGIYFVALGNFPGHLAKRVYQKMGFEGVFGRLGRNRKAYFKTVICYKDASATKLFIGTLRGTIAEKAYPGGRAQLPYEKIFIFRKKPFSLLALEEKVAVSHRTIAARKFAGWFIRHRIKKML